jgi:predicted MPP superfamily phosphohydrolase
MSPTKILRRAIDLHGRQVSSRMRIPGGRERYARWFREMRVDFSDIVLDIRPDRIGPAGIELVQISDIHSGPYVNGADLNGVMDRVTALQPDLIVLTGDYVNREPEELEPALPALARLSARGGVWAVLGNHDFWGDGGRVAGMLEGVGIRMLRNEGTDIEIDGTRFHLAGVDDWKEGEADLPLASRDRTDGMLSILLSHCPQIVDEAADIGYDLVLSGHTHGMQVRLPLFRHLQRDFMHNRHDHGHSRHGAEGGTHLFITRGLGVVTLPWRYKCPPEVSRIVLRPKAA